MHPIHVHINMWIGEVHTRRRLRNSNVPMIVQSLMIPAAFFVVTLCPLAHRHINTGPECAGQRGLDSI